MMVDWPDTLPQFKLTGIVDQRLSAKLRSSVDVGPAIVRRRYTASIRNIDQPMTFSDDQKNAFDDFWVTDLDQGVSSFDWTDPSGNAVTMRFRSDDAPAFTASEGGDGKRWNTTFQLEILP